MAVSDNLNDDDHTDSDYLAVWELLTYWKCSHAAVGLLCDLFSLLAKVDFPALERLRKAEGREMKMANRAVIQEIAMSMINDQDGQKLKEWTQKFQSDRKAFLELAKQRVEDVCCSGA